MDQRQTLLNTHTHAHAHIKPIVIEDEIHDTHAYSTLWNTVTATLHSLSIICVDYAKRLIIMQLFIAVIYCYILFYMY